MHKTGETVAVQFAVSDPETGGLVNADALPAGVLILNGANNAATVTVVNVSTGVYSASVTLPTIADGDELQIRIAATVATVAGGGIVWQGEGVTKRPADVADAVWAYATRTLTQTSAAVAAALTGSTITIRRGDTLTVSIAGLGSLAGRTKLWIAAKADRGHPDAAALFLIEETSKLSVINGTPATTSTNGTLTVTDAVAGDITIVLAGAETAKLAELTGGAYDVQILEAAGPRTLTDGTLNITLDVTRATT
jgi:hypothetical protein